MEEEKEETSPAPAEPVPEEATEPEAKASDAIPPAAPAEPKDLASEIATQTSYEEKDRMMRHFRFAHLPPHLQDVSHRFAALARWIVDSIPSSPERTVALRKVLEGKDCAVRARLEADELAAKEGPGRAPGVSGK